MAAEEYLANLSLNVADLQRRLEDAEGTLFVDDEINVRITDIGDGEIRLQHSSTSSSETL
jgi:hypothetical protein